MKLQNDTRIGSGAAESDCWIASTDDDMYDASGNSPLLAAANLVDQLNVEIETARRNAGGE